MKILRRNNNKTKVFFCPAKIDDAVGEIALKLLKALIKENKIVLEKEIPLKVHPGNTGNISYIKPENFSAIIEYLQSQKIKTYYVETNQAPNGERSCATNHLKIAMAHGFTQIPFIIADGEDGFDHVLVKINGGKHFRDCKIAAKLANKHQVIVLSHFKGHMLSGFGGAIKMLALGFASGRGKVELHSKTNLADGEAINWTKIWSVYVGKAFRERSAEYALAASQNKNFIYLNFALNLVKNCDCDGRAMQPIYTDLGIFASTDPVAIDKACFDLLAKREKKRPFGGEDIFGYAQKIGLGKTNYQLIKISKVS